MPIRHPIDIAALKARFRAAATARGIDPVEGATSFQVVHHVAARPRVVSDWWKDHELWDREDDPIYHSFIEEHVFDRLRLAAYLHYLETNHAAVQAALADDDDADLPPLRECLAARGEQLVWVDAGDGSTLPQVTIAV